MISDVINNRANNNTSNLLHQEGAASTASILVWTSNIANYMQDEKQDLADKYNKLWDKTEKQREEYLHDLSETGDFEKIIKNAARYGKKGSGGRRGFEYLFATEGGSEAREILVYKAIVDNESPEQRYSAEQFEILKNERWSQHPLGPDHSESIDLHHNVSVRNPDLSPEEQVIQASNPNNITPEAKSYHRIISHQGNTRIPTNDHVEDVSDKYDEIQDLKESRIEKVENSGEIFALGVGLLSGTMSAIIKYRQLSKSSLPWNKAKIISLLGSFAYGASTGVIPFIAVSAVRDNLDNLIDAGLLDVFNESSLPEDEFLDNVGDALGGGGAIILAIVLRSGLSFLRDAKNQGSEVASGYFKDRLKRVVLEQSGFIVMEIILDSVTPWPDPTISTIITATRIIYSCSRFVVNMKQKKKLNQKRMMYIEEAAYATLGLE